MVHFFLSHRCPLPSGQKYSIQVMYDDNGVEQTKILDERFAEHWEALRVCRMYAEEPHGEVRGKTILTALVVRVPDN